MEPIWLILAFLVGAPAFDAWWRRRAARDEQQEREVREAYERGHRHGMDAD